MHRSGVQGRQTTGQLHIFPYWLTTVLPVKIHPGQPQYQRHERTNTNKNDSGGKKGKYSLIPNVFFPILKLTKELLRKEEMGEFVKQVAAVCGVSDMKFDGSDRWLWICSLQTVCCSAHLPVADFWSSWIHISLDKYFDQLQYQQLAFANWIGKQRIYTS